MANLNEVIDVLDAILTCNDCPLFNICENECRETLEKFFSNKNNVKIIYENIDK